MRIVTTPDQIDFTTPGRRDYFVSFEHPTLWGYYHMPVTVIAGPQAGKGRGLVATGANHGNEYEGPVALQHLIREIKTEDVRGRLILIPTLNVSAFRAGVRDTPDDGINLNRAFPGNPTGSLTYRIADFVMTKIFPHVHVVLDIHAGGRVARFAHLTSFHRVADPAQQRAMEETARGFGTRFSFYYQDQTPGLLPSAAERLGKITVGGEFGWGEAVDPAGVSMARQGILSAAIRHEQLAAPLPANAHCPREEQILVDASDLKCYVRAPFEGHFEPSVRCGDKVAQGQLIGFVHDFNHIDDAPARIVAPHEGYVVSQAWQAKVLSGQVISVVPVKREWM